MQRISMISTAGLPAGRGGIEQWFAAAGLPATVVARCPVVGCAACRQQVPAAA